jgi:branched-chain amino acid aminotransferase
MNNKEKLHKLYEESLVNVNGVITKAEEAKISVFDRGFLYGDSIYEVTYSEDYCIYFLDEHLDRLYQSANIINLEIFLNRDELIKEIIKTLKESKIAQAYIRLIITRGETEITLDPNSSFKNNYIIIVKPKPIYNENFYSKGLKLALVSSLSNSSNPNKQTAKSGNYLNNVLAMNEAKQKNFDDALMINNHGDITEGTTFNIWMVKDNIIYTPPIESGLLKGITREKIIQICSENNLTLKMEKFSPKDILNADEVFITSSGRQVMPIYKINDKIYGEGINEWKMIKLLSTKYKELVEKYKCKKEYTYT